MGHGSPAHCRYTQVNSHIHRKHKKIKMFVYLSKKIAIPGQLNLHSISWNALEGWIACGGDGGILKVLKLEQSDQYIVNSDDIARAQFGSIAAQNNLSSNQTLQNHKDRVSLIAWNEVERRLTSGDATGVINVWRLDFSGQWVEDMNSDRGKSHVRALKWTHDGKKICIAYEDGKS